MVGTAEPIFKEPELKTEETYLDSLLSALKRLDCLLEQAADAAQSRGRAGRGGTAATGRSPYAFAIRPRVFGHRGR